MQRAACSEEEAGLAGNQVVGVFFAAIDASAGPAMQMRPARVTVRPLLQEAAAFVLELAC